MDSAAKAKAPTSMLAEALFVLLMMMITSYLAYRHRRPLEALEDDPQGCH